MQDLFSFHPITPLSSSTHNFVPRKPLLLWSQEKISRLDRVASSRQWPLRFLSQVVGRLPRDSVSRKKVVESVADRNTIVASGKPAGREQLSKARGKDKIEDV